MIFVSFKIYKHALFLKKKITVMKVETNFMLLSSLRYQSCEMSLQKLIQLAPINSNIRSNLWN